MLRRRIGVAIICALIVPATALAYSYTQEEEYSASASLLFRDPGFSTDLFGSSAFTPSTDPDREAATNLRLVSLGVVAARTADRLGSGLSRRDVASKVEASSEGQSNVVAITATAASPRRAALLANTFAEEYITFRRNADRRKIEQTLDIVGDQLAALSPAERAGPQGQELRQQVKQLGLLSSLQTGNAELVERADLPTSPSSPKTTRNVIVGVLLGIMLGLGMAFLVDRIDRRLRDIDEIQDIFERPTLAQVPKDRSLRRREWQRERLPPVVAETFQMLRATLRYFHSGQKINSVLIASAAPDDGKTTVAWNLAAAAAGAGNRVLFIEADLRQPEMASYLGVPPVPGLSEFLVDAADFDAVVHRIPVNPSSSPSSRDYAVEVIAAGRRPPNPTDLIESKQMRFLLARASSTYDLVVLDTPPTTIVSDAVPLLTQVSGVLVVVRLGKSTRKGAQSLQRQLKQLDAPTLGVVVNAAGKGAEPYGYGYLDYYNVDPDEEAAEPEAAPAEPEPSKADSDEAAPSWIYNRLIVTGEPPELGEFVERAQGELDDETGERVPLDFNGRPRGRFRRVSLRRGNGSNGWQAKTPERKGRPRDGEVVYLFASAPSPPREWLEKVSEKHPDLSFALEFIEEYCEEAGGARWRGGTVVETWEIDPDGAEWVEDDDGDGRRRPDRHSS